MSRRVSIRNGLLAALALAVGSADARAQTAAVVNGEQIALGEVDAVLAGRPAGLTPLTPGQQRQFRLEILAGLIDDRLFRQFLDRHGPKVEPAEIEQQMRALAEAQASQEKTLEDFYRETGQSEAQVRAGLHNMLRFARYVEQNATDEQLRAYYERNKDFFDKITVRASHLVIRVPAEGGLDERKTAQDQLADLRKQLAEGKLEFADAAKQYSHCPSGPKGGDIGYFTRKYMTDDAFAAAAFAMKVGELSEVVETDFGLHLIRVTDRTAGEPSSFDTVQDEVRDAYGEDLRQSLLAKLRKEASVSITLP